MLIRGCLKLAWIRTFPSSRRVATLTSTSSDRDLYYMELRPHEVHQSLIVYRNVTTYRVTQAQEDGSDGRYAPFPRNGCVKDSRPAAKDEAKASNKQKSTNAMTKIGALWKARVLPHFEAVSFITLHYAYFISTCMLTAIVFWGSSTPAQSVRFIDSVFLVTSAMTEAGLNTVNLSTLWVSSPKYQVCWLTAAGTLGSKSCSSSS